MQSACVEAVQCQLADKPPAQSEISLALLVWRNYWRQDTVGIDSNPTELLLEVLCKYS